MINNFFWFIISIPNRTNIILTRDKNLKLPGCIVVHSIEEGINFARKNNESELLIVGGSEIYKMAEPISDIIYLTEVKSLFNCDTHFKYNTDIWEEYSRESFPNDEKNDYNYSFIKLIKNNL